MSISWLKNCVSTWASEAERRLEPFDPKKLGYLQGFATPYNIVLSVSLVPADSNPPK
jgi:hypothetical protein